MGEEPGYRVVQVTTPSYPACVFQVVTRASVKALGKEFRVLNATWAFAEKERAHSEGEKEASARVAAGGYGQELYVDYNKTYAPTMCLTAYKANEADAANDESITRECWDISGAYYLTTPIYVQYMKEPPGFETGKDNIWRLHKCMPGTKDAGHCYNVQLTKLLTDKIGFKVNPADNASFRLVSKTGDFINLNIHVDDTAVFSSSQKLMDVIFNIINKDFPMKRRKGIGLMVGIKSERDEEGIHLSQTTLIEDIVRMAGLQQAKAVSTPCHGTFKGFTPEDITLDPKRRKVYDEFPYRQLVGKIAYVARNTRIDIAWITCELQRYGTNYTEAQIDALLHLIKYLNATKSMKLTFRSDFKHDINLFFAVDAGYGSSLINRASHEGLITFYKGCPIAHSAKRQKVIALSSMESEFMAAHEAAKFSKWLRRLLAGFGMSTKKPVPLLEDNQAAIYLSKHPSLNGSRSRHMEIRWHWLQQAVEEEDVELVYIPTASQFADILTKPTSKHVHDVLVPVIMGKQPAYTPAVVQALNTMIKEHKKQGKAFAMLSNTSRQACQSYFHKEQRNASNVVQVKQVKRKAKPRTVDQPQLWPLTKQLAILLLIAALHTTRKIFHWISLKGCHLFADAEPAKRMNYDARRSRQRRQSQRKRHFQPRGRAMKPKPRQHRRSRRS